jgi:peptidoglycan/xylan/chitin deacetylase (PgdA/CDA1 family)
VRADATNTQKCRLKGVVFLTFDVEPDAPPYQSSETRGIREGLPRILELLEEKGVRATFFVTASLLSKYSWLPDAILSGGHELASHGLDHSRLDKVPISDAITNISKSINILRKYSDISSFRAPNLQLPESIVRELPRLGIKVDSSIAVYKPGHPKYPHWRGELFRLPATATSSTIRLPRLLATRLTLHPEKEFHVLFYHPWEFTRIPRKPLYRPDVWARTGEYAVRMLSYIIDLARARGYRFALVGEAPGLCV